MNYFLNAGFPKFVALIGVVALRSTAWAQTYNVPDGGQARFGRGFDSLTNELRADCVTATSAVTPSGNGKTSQKVFYKLTAVTSLDALRSELSMSASASASAGLWGGSAEMNFTRSSNVSSFKSYFLVTVTVMNSPLVQSPKLSPLGEKLKGDPQEFWKRCGDQFVSAEISGGEFSAIVEYESYSREDREALQTQMNLSGGTFSVHAALATAFASVGTHTKRTVTLLRTGPIAAIPGLTPEELMKYASEFPLLVEPGAHPYVYRFVVSKYNSVPDAPVFHPEVVDNNRRVLEASSLKLEDGWKLRNSLDYVLDHPYSFVIKDPPVELEGIRASRNAADVFVNSVSATVSSCLQPNKKCAPSTSVLPAATLPEWVSDKQGCRQWSEGKCVYCEFRTRVMGDPPHLAAWNAPDVFGVTCSGMAVDALVQVRAAGTVTAYEGSGNLWVDLELRDQPDISTETHQEVHQPPNDRRYIDLMRQVTASAGKASASLFVNRCTSSGAGDHCRLQIQDDFRITFRVPLEGRLPK